MKIEKNMNNNAITRKKILKLENHDKNKFNMYEWFGIGNSSWSTPSWSSSSRFSLIFWSCFRTPFITYPWIIGQSSCPNFEFINDNIPKQLIFQQEKTSSISQFGSNNFNNLASEVSHRWECCCTWFPTCQRFLPIFQVYWKVLEQR